MNPTTEQLNNRLVATGQSPSPAPKIIDGATLGTQNSLKLASQQFAPIPDISTLAVAQPPTTETEKPRAESTLSQRLAGLITASKGKEADVASSVSQATSPYTQQLNEINTQIKLLQANSIARQEKALQAGETQGFASREAQNVQRTDAIEALKLSALQSGLQGNIALAEQQATNAVNAKYAQNEKDIEDAKTNIYNNYDSLSPAEKKQADATLLRLDANDAFVKQRKEEEVRNQNLINVAVSNSLKNGVSIPNTVLQNAVKSESYIDTLNMLSPYMIDVDARTLSSLQIEGERLKNQKLRAEITANQPITGEFADVINGAVSIVAGTKKDQVKTVIGNALASGDYTTAFAGVANAVEDSLTGTNKTKFADARTDIGVMKGMKDAIQAFADAGGDMGYLKGTADSIAKRFGQLKTDPKFASLAIQLEREFQSYRNNMTGAAFSPAESAEYAKVNPRGNATLDLNLTTIDGALAQLTNRVVSTVTERLPGAQKIYDKILETASPTQSTKGEQRLPLDEAFAEFQKLTQPQNTTTQPQSKAQLKNTTTGTFQSLPDLSTGYKPFTLGSFLK